MGGSAWVFGFTLSAHIGEGISLKLARNFQKGFFDKREVPSPVVNLQQNKGISLEHKTANL
jgi:hypothetical protein